MEEYINASVYKNVHNNEKLKTKAIGEFIHFALQQLCDDRFVCTFTLMIHSHLRHFRSHETLHAIVFLNPIIS